MNDTDELEASHYLIYSPSGAAYAVVEDTITLSPSGNLISHHGLLRGLTGEERAALAPTIAAAMTPRATEIPGEYRPISRPICEWPGCTTDAFATSGNYGGRPVCRKHFRITNGADVAGEVLTASDVLSDDAYEDECAMRAMGAYLHRAGGIVQNYAIIAMNAYAQAAAMREERTRRRG